LCFSSGFQENSVHILLTVKSPEGDQRDRNVVGRSYKYVNYCCIGCLLLMNSI